MDFQIGDIVNWREGGFAPGSGRVAEIVNPLDWPAYNAVVNPAYKIQFSDGNWTIVDGSNLVKV